MATDQFSLPLRRAGAPVRVPPGTGTAVIAVVGAALLGGLAAQHPEQWRGLLAAALVVNLVVLSLRWPRAAAVTTLLVWLPVVGLTRRLLISEAGWTTNDPLLLVGPVVAIFLCYRLFILEKRTLAADRISKLVLFLLVLSLVEAFNPFGVGGVAGGLGGLIYLGVPLLWFLIGREIGDRKSMTVLIYGVALLGIALGFYGLYQTEWGHFPSWDLDWYHITGFNSLGSGRTEGGSLELRPWSSFPSNSEYSAFLGIGVAFAAALFFHRKVALAVIAPFLVLALFLAGGRSVMALMILTLMVVAALRTHNRYLAVAVVILGIGTAYGAALVFGDRLDRAASGEGANAERQTGGLLNPLDPNHSTFLSHWSNLRDGVKAGFTNPVGQGTGASNLGAKVGSGGGGATDNDVGNVFVSYGFVGGFAFVILILLSFKTVFSRYLRGPPDPQLLAVAGLLVVTFGQWLNGGHYMTASLLWFMLGWAVRPRPEEGEADESLIPARWGQWGPLRRLRGEPA